MKPIFAQFRAGFLVLQRHDGLPLQFHQGLESRPISRLSGEHQCDLGWSLHLGISSSYQIYKDCRSAFF